MVYAENIKKIRNNFNLSIAKMASKLGMSSRTLTSYEREERKPSCDFAYKLYKTFNININWFVSGEGEMFNKNPNEVYATTKIKEILKENGLI